MIYKMDQQPIWSSILRSMGVERVAEGGNLTPVATNQEGPFNICNR